MVRRLFVQRTMSRSKSLLATAGWLRQRPWVRTYASGQMDSFKVLLVESPAKAKKIQEFLGKQYKVLASYGHVRDLPPKSGSVLPDNNFEMRWETLRNSEKHIGHLQEVLSERDGSDQTLLLATDPDREGEAISWHIMQELENRGALGNDTSVQRIVFTEITKEAVANALENPRGIDERLVQAYLARRALDYLLGFHLSPILWRKIPGATSAGRVQSVALRLVCEREDEIERFTQSLYWTIHCHVQLSDGSTVWTDLVRARGERVPSPGYEALKDVEALIRGIETSDFHVKSVGTRTLNRQPKAPFNTSTLQQEANKSLGFGASKTMQLAQELYEGGIITYMRTDSLSISNTAADAIQKAVSTLFGSELVPPGPRVHAQKKSVNAQEAHEAIRPTDPLVTPHSISHRGYSSPAIKLYTLIRNRALASQSKDSATSSIQAVFSNSKGDLELKATASKLDFPGFMAVQGVADEEEIDQKAVKYSTLSSLQQGDHVDIKSAFSEEHATKPPPRYTEGSLVKAMEDLGIGRPSTYAPTIKLLYARNYVKDVNKRLHAEAIGRILTSFLRKYAPEYIDYSYTSSLEADFDRISQGEEDWMEVMKNFWTRFEETSESLSRLSGIEVLDMLNDDMKDYVFRQTSDLVTGTVESGRQCPMCENDLSLKLSHKGGPFIGCSSYPACSYTRSLPICDDIDPKPAMDGLSKTFKNMNMAEKYGMRGSVRLLGMHPDSNMEIFVRQGPYGPYIQLGTDKDPSMKRIPLPKDAKPRSLTMKYALSMLTLPRTLGSHPETHAPVEVRNGKFGPFILHGNQMRSIPKEIDPLEITLEDGLVLLKLSSENKKFTKQRTQQSDRSNATHSDDIHPSVPRTRSAYQFFLKDYLSKYQMKNGKEKMRIMGEHWKSLDTKEKQQFQDMADDDLIRFQIQQSNLLQPTIEAWESLLPEEKQRLQSQLASVQVSSRQHPVKRPKSAYTLFMQDLSEEMKQHGSDGTHKGSFMTLVAKKWRNLSDADRASYAEKADKQKQDSSR